MISKILIIGASVAGIKAAAALRAQGFSGAIQVVGQEDHLPYDKPPLSKEFLTSMSPVSAIALLEPDEYAAKDIDLVLGRSAQRLDVRQRSVNLSDGGILGYDVAVIATGARVDRLPFGPGDLAHLRTLDDAQLVRSRLSNSRSVVVVGGGVLGCELAAAARALGREVTLIERAGALMAEALGGPEAAVLAAAHRDHGVKLKLGTALDSIDGTFDGGYRLNLADGTRMESDLVITAVGDRPNVEWLAGSPLELHGGVLTDQNLATTTVDNIYAIGDVAVGRDSLGRRTRTRHWTAAVEQAELIAHTIVHGPSRENAKRPEYFWSDQYDLKVQSVGMTTAGDQVAVIQPDEGSPTRRLMLHSQQGRITAAVTINWPKASSLLRSAWLDERRRVDVIRQMELGSRAGITA